MSAGAAAIAGRSTRSSRGGFVIDHLGHTSFLRYRETPDSSRPSPPYGRFMRAKTALTCALILTASACGGGGGSDKASSSNASTTETTATGDTAAASPTEGPCLLLEDDEVASVVGGPVDHEFEEATDEAGEGCSWQRLDGEPGLIAVNYLNEFQLTRLRDTIASYEGDDRGLLLPIGDGAILEEPFGISFVAGEVGLQVFLTDMPNRNDATFESLARSVLARL